MRKLIILGAGVMQGPAIKAAKEAGFETIVVDADASAPCASLADRFERIDLKDKEGMEALARSLQADGGLSGIMTAGTDFSATVAWVAERIGLPGIPYETALNASDKERMRECFKRAGVPSPAFTSLSAEPDEGWTPPFPFPVVVKPVDNMGARGCRRAETMPELREAAREALPFSRSNRIIIEEYMEGPEFSIDAIVYKGEITITGLADRHIVFPPYFIEMGHTMPSCLPDMEAEALLAVFKAGVRALGLADAGNIGAAKGDIKLTPSGPMIGEIAARLSGGYMSGWTYPYSSDVNLIRAAVEIAGGGALPSLSAARDWTSAERAFISIPGVIRAVIGADAARAVPGVRDLFLRVKAGDAVCFPVNNVSKAGNVISAAPTRDEAIHAAETAVHAVLIRLEAPHPATDSFLNVSNKPENSSLEEKYISDELIKRVSPKFPPDAFDMDERLWEELEKIPIGIEKKDVSFYNKENIRGVSLSLCPFPAFEASALKDYQGRSVLESLEAVRTVTGLPLPVREDGNIGRLFWRALVRGGYQGAAYLLDCMVKEE